MGCGVFSTAAAVSIPKWRGPAGLQEAWPPPSQAYKIAAGPGQRQAMPQILRPGRLGTLVAVAESGTY